MFHLRFSTALLVTATSLLLTADGSAEKVITCDESNSVQRLLCDTGVIQVQAALYGRTDNKTCSVGRTREQLANTDCSQRGTVDVLRRRCNGKRVCELNTNVVHSPNPCPNIYKYLETTYNCFPAFHLVICDHSVAHLFCDEGQVIFVYGADYGRHDQTTCSYKRPSTQIQDVYCSRPTTIVADSCNGRNSCDISVNTLMFGDPCPGTYKYLEVAYICEYR